MSEPEALAKEKRVMRSAPEQTVARSAASSHPSVGLFLSDERQPSSRCRCETRTEPGGKQELRCLLQA